MEAHHGEDLESAGFAAAGNRRNTTATTSSSSSSSSRIQLLERQCLTWSRVPLSSSCCIPPPRSGAASVIVKNRLYMFGGYGGGTGRLDDFYSYSFETQTWEEVTVLSEQRPGCRENNGVVIGDDSRVYLFGGYNGTYWLNDLWMFDIDTQRWSCIQDSSDPQLQNAPEQPIGSSSIHHDATQSALGSTSSSHGNNETSAAALQPSTTTRGVRGRIPSRRFGYVSVVHNHKFVLFGGFDGSRWLNDMYEFDFATRTWTEISPRGALPSVRSCPAWAKDDTHVYIQGGYDGVERKADFFAWDLTTYTWTEMSCLGTPPSPRYFHSCCLHGNKLYLYGGYSGNERLADMHAFDFETNHWSEVDCTNGDAPSGRSSLVAQVYENCMYIFGGYNGVTVLNDFYKFRLKPISVPPSGLVQDLGHLIDNAEFGDVRFLVDGREVHANRAILAVRSDYFKAMLFSGGMRESVEAGTPIELKDVSYGVFLKVIEYLYTDTVRDLSLDVGIHLLIASERFMLDRLKALCEDFIRRDVNVDNVIGILVASHQHNASGLKDIALEFMLKNLSEPIIMKGLTDLKSEPELLVEIIKRNSTASSPAAGSAGSSSPRAEHPPAGPPGPFGAGGSDWSARR